MSKRAASIGRALLMLALVVAQVSAQRKRVPVTKSQSPATAVAPVVNLDTLLAAESYKIYGEVRGVGHCCDPPALTMFWNQ